jgi:oligopeptide transport system permease protein
VSGPSTASSASVPMPVRGRSPMADALRRLRRNRFAVAGAVFLVLLVLACFVLPVVAGLDSERQETRIHDQAPSGVHWFGTDNLGRDYLARVLVGGQTSLKVGLVATLVSLLIGTLWGATAGYFGGFLDDLMMRIVDFLYGIPYMFLVILIMLLFDDKARGNPLPMFAALGAVQWLTMARIVRGQVIGLKHQEFVLAAKTMGASHRRIILKHLLPNCLGPIIIYATLTVPSVILTEAFLSFLGLGVKVSWGVLVAEAPFQDYLWRLAFPSAFLAATLLSLNFLGDGLRDALDPRTRK